MESVFIKDAPQSIGKVLRELEKMVGEVELVKMAERSGGGRLTEFDKQSLDEARQRAKKEGANGERTGI